MSGAPSLAGGAVLVNDACRLRGIVQARAIRKLKEALWELHREKKDVLFRYTDARNAPLWTTWAVLHREFPTLFGESEEVTSLDVLDLRREVLELRARVGRLEMKVGTG